MSVKPEEVAALLARIVQERGFLLVNALGKFPLGTRLGSVSAGPFTDEGTLDQPYMLIREATYAEFDEQIKWIRANCPWGVWPDVDWNSGDFADNFIYEVSLD